jgi:hypothetical protein
MGLPLLGRRQRDVPSRNLRPSQNCRTSAVTSPHGVVLRPFRRPACGRDHDLGRSGCGCRGEAAARERVRVAKALSDLPLVATAFHAGRMSWSQVRAVTRVATDGRDGNYVLTRRGPAEDAAGGRAPTCLQTQTLQPECSDRPALGLGSARRRQDPATEDPDGRAKHPPRAHRAALANLVLVCSRHHTLIHPHGFQLAMDDDSSPPPRACPCCITPPSPGGESLRPRPGPPGRCRHHHPGLGRAPHGPRLRRLGRHAAGGLTVCGRGQRRRTSSDQPRSS